MKIAIIGSGYVGLTTALSFANYKHNVMLHDIQKNKIEKLKKGIPTFYEKGLSNLLNIQLKKKRIHFTDSFKKTINFSNIIFICVGTPSLRNGDANLGYIKNIIKKIEKQNFLKKKFSKILIIKSTIPPSTTDKLVKNLNKKKFHKKLYFATNPEFLKEGSALNDSLYPDKIVIGYKDIIVKKNLQKLYKKFKTKKFFTNFRTAEMAKYASNYFLACLISASNEISNLSTKLGNIDFDQVLETIKEDARWNNKNKNIYPKIHNYLVPGPGFGGSCFKKDLKALNYLNKKHKNSNFISKSILKINSIQYYQLIEKLKKLEMIKKNKKILILGLSFKENTDDIRETRTLPIVKYLKNKAKIYLYKDLGYSLFCKKILQGKNVIYLSNFKNQTFNSLVIMNKNKKYVEIAKNLIKRNPKMTIFDVRGLLKFKDYVKINNYYRY